MSTNIAQARRTYKYEGIIGLIKRIRNLKKVVDRYRCQLLIPVEETVWGTYMISAKNVRNCSLPSGYLPPKGKDAVYGIYDGNWDTYSEPFEETTFYQSMYARFVEGIPWEETTYYRTAAAELDRKGGTVWNGCRTRDDMRKRAETIDAMYRSMADRGYQFEKEGETYRVVGDFEVCDRLIAGIDRHGNVLRLANGRHRLAVAKLLDVPIPATVTLCHAKYIDRNGGFSSP